MSKIEFFSEDISEVDIDKKLYRKCIKNLISAEGKSADDISIIFCSDAYLLQINRQYLQHDFYTDIITFDYNEGNSVSGDLFISIERIGENAAIFGSSFQVELSRVIFHGILHLCGYGDKTEDEEVAMRAKENFYLKEFGFANE